MWGSFIAKKDDYRNFTIRILLAHNVQGCICILRTWENWQKLESI